MTRFLNRGLLLAGLAVTVTATMTGPAIASDGGHGPHGGSRDGSHCPKSSYLYHYGKDGLTAIGLTLDQKLIKFDVRKPDKAYEIGEVAGLEGDDHHLVGIDYRVQDDELYGVGDAGGVYVLSACKATATKVSQLTVELDGSHFGVDFNPAADRLRVISDTGQNLRHDVNSGGATVVDGSLIYPPATVTAEGLTGAAYTNNDLSPETATTLFDIDTHLDQVAIQSPANAGSLAATGVLRVDAGIQAGFDIYSTNHGERTVKLDGFATLEVDGRSKLYQIELLVGDADELGSFANEYLVTDLALPLDQN